MTCELCYKEHKSYGALHRHLASAHKTNQKDYYTYFFSRYDLHDGSQIEFKDRESYLSADFNSKETLVGWLLANPDKAKEYSLKILTDRSERKGNLRRPTHAELKSLFAPNLIDYEKIFGGIEQFEAAATKAGLLGLGTETLTFKSGEMKVLQDTREQYPLSFDCPVVVQKLACGDYCPSSDFFCDLFIERKSLADLAGTLTSGYERFQREIDRAVNLGFYLVVLVECKYSELEDYSPKNSFSQRIGGGFLLNRMRSLMNSNIQFLFSSSRQKSSELAEKIFRMGNQAKRVDLEFLKDKGVI